jgi:glycosyltransferase involved in cell wall biosynthesis
VLIPTYREAASIRSTLEAVCRELEASGLWDYEVIVLDDNSGDGTVEAALEYAERSDYRVRVAVFSNRMGKGGSLRNGLRLAQGDIIVFLDADLPVEVGRISQMVRLVERGYGLVVTKRVFLGGGSYNLSRRILSFGFNTLVRVMFRTGLDDHQVGFKALSVGVARRLVDQVRSDGFFFDTELIVQVKRMNVPVAAIEVVWRDRRLPGDSKIPPMRALITMFADLVALRLSFINGRRLIGLRAEEAGVLRDLTDGVAIKATRLFFSTRNRRFLNQLSKLYFMILFGRTPRDEKRRTQPTNHAH